MENKTSFDLYLSSLKGDAAGLSAVDIHKECCATFIEHDRGHRCVWGSSMSLKSNISNVRTPKHNTRRSSGFEW